MTTLIYKPEGAEPKSWDIEPDNMTSDLLEAIEDATDWTIAEWVNRLQRGSIKAIHALLWVLLRQDSPDLPFDAVVFTASDFDIDFGAPKKKAKSGKA